LIDFSYTLLYLRFAQDPNHLGSFFYLIFKLHNLAMKKGEHVRYDTLHFKYVVSISS
jgi:hypothetical protein